MSGENESGPPSAERNEAPAGGEHITLKVTDFKNEVPFKIKRSTKLEKVMVAFLKWRGGNAEYAVFIFSGIRVQKSDTPDSLEMLNGDTIEVHWEIGGYPCADGSCQCCA
ncbi:ubiquitin family protein [Xylaria venustula]|nr:ubiquitin family protein [Xylaria venustula]